MTGTLTALMAATLTAQYDSLDTEFRRSKQKKRQKLPLKSLAQTRPALQNLDLLTFYSSINPVS